MKKWTTAALMVIVMGLFWSCSDDDNSTNPDNQEETWQKIFGGNYDYAAESVVQTNDGGYAIAGFTGDYPEYDFLLMKVNSKGDKLWQKTFNNIYEDRAYSMQQTSDGGFILTGSTGFSEGEFDHPGNIWLVKTNSEGIKSWEKKFCEDTEYESSRSVIETSDGGFLITGFYNDGLWIIKTNSSGSLSWEKKYPNENETSGYAIIESSNGSYVITGYVTDSNYNQDVLIISLDNNGNEQLYKTYDFSDGDHGNSLVETTDGGYIITGNLEITDENSDLLVFKIDSNGNKIWENTYGGNASDTGETICHSDNGNFIIVGYTRSYGQGSGDVWLIKLDENGNKIWDKTYGGAEDEWGNSVVQSNDGGYIISGGAESNDNGDWYDIFLIKTDSDGDIN